MNFPFFYFENDTFLKIFEVCVNFIMLTYSRIKNILKNILVYIINLFTFASSFQKRAPNSK